MSRTHGIGIVAAIGALTAAVALLTGLPAASADEVSELRTQMELLQRRIDQLAQLPPTKAFPGTPGALGTEAMPGVPMAGGSFPRSFLIPGTRPRSASAALSTSPHSTICRATTM